jgi:hypothetical protein
MSATTSSLQALLGNILTPEWIASARAQCPGADLSELTAIP